MVPSSLHRLIQRGVTVMANTADGASTGEWIQQLDKEGWGLPWLSLHTGEFRSCVYLLFAPLVCFSVQLPALLQSTNAGSSDPLTYTVAATLCAHNGQKGLTGILCEHDNVYVRWVCIRISFTWCMPC